MLIKMAFKWLELHISANKANSCTFLGHNIGQGNITPVEAKIEAIQNFPQPRTKKDLQAWLGLTGYYHRFIPGYADLTARSTDTLAGHKPERIQWNKELQEDFIKLKDIIAGDMVLRAPDFGKYSYFIQVQMEEELEPSSLSRI